MKPFRPFVALTAVLGAAPLPAATRTWDGGDAGANLNAAANWNGNTAIDPAADLLVFPAGLAVADKTLNNSYAVNTLFRSFLFQEGGYTLGGTILGLGNGPANGIVCQHAAGTVTVNAGVSMQQSLDFETSSGGSLVFGAGSQIYLNSHSLALIPGQSGSTIAVGGLLAGGGAITISGAGDVAFSGAKTFGAGITLTGGGKLTIDDSAGLGLLTGGTALENGILTLSSAAPLSIGEALTLNNVSGAAEIVSKGGAHVLSGALTFSNPGLKHLQVDGTSLALTGVMAGTGPLGGIQKTGEGRLVLSGGVSNTCDLQIFRVARGECVLSKSGGATAIVNDYLAIGVNGGDEDKAIARLGAAHQIDDQSRVDIEGDGWFDLNGFAETIDALRFQASGRATTGTGTLQIDDYVWAINPAASGSPATFTGTLTLGAVNSEWDIHPGVPAKELVVTGSVTSLVADARITKKGEGTLAFAGPVNVPHLVVTEGAVVAAGSSPAMNVEMSPVNTAQFYGTGTVGRITATKGFVNVGEGVALATLACKNLSVKGPAGIFWELTGAGPGEHDQIEVTGTVDLTGASLAFVHVGPHTTVPGDEVVLIENDGTDPIVGEFSGQEEGHIAAGYRYSYRGGDGNDFTLTRLVEPTGTTRLWDGGGADDKWGTAGNWNPNGIPQQGDDLVFPTAALKKSGSNDFPTGFTFNSITVHGTGYSLGGNGILLNDRVEFTSLTGDHLFGVPLKLVLPARISIAGSAFVQFGGAINTNGKQLTLHNSGPPGEGDLYLSGTISGTGGVLKTGPGDITFFEQPHTYTGLTVVAAGMLALKADATLGASGAASGTRIEAGATLRIRNNEGDVHLSETITLLGTITDNGGTFAGLLDGPLIIPSSGVIATEGDRLELAGVISGAGILRKSGPGVLTLGGTQSNTLSGALMADEGKVVLRKSMPGVNALDCPLIIGNAGLPVSVELGAANQLADDLTIQIVHPAAIFDTKARDETIGALVMNGGTVQGGGRLTLSAGVVNVQENAAVAVIKTPLALPFGGTGELQVSDGAAATDLRIDDNLFGGSWQKTGAGRVDFTASMPVEAFDSLNLSGGSALFFGNCGFTAVQLNGGLLGGQGTVGKVTTPGSGIVSPGVDAGTGAFGGGQAVWNGATTLAIALNGPDPGSQYDQYFANGATTLGGAQLDLKCGFDPAPGASFMVVRNVSGSPLTGTFANAPEGGYVSAPGARVFQVSYLGGDGDDAVLTRMKDSAPVIVSHQVVAGNIDKNQATQVELFAKGFPGLTYLVESSTDLAIWQERQQSMAAAGTGLLTFQFAEAPGTPRLFYRVRLP